MYRIENMDSGTVLGTYPGESKEDALNAMAQDAGYQGTDDIPNFNADELLVTEV